MSELERLSEEAYERKKQYNKRDDEQSEGN